ncbi:MAG: TaqI-like C-terminal specificity domain-containing protein [Ginsengibacter sp.]
MNNFSLRELADLGNDVFSDVVTTAIILVASKSVPAPNKVIRIIKDFTEDRTQINLSDLVANSFLIMTNISDSGTSLMKKIIINSVLLGNESKEMIFAVVITKNKDEIVSETPHDGYKPFLEGRDITSYFIRPVHQYLNYKPELLYRARTKEVFEVSEKLLVQRITVGRTPLKVAYDDNKFYNKESINNIILKDASKFTTKFILTLLNST